jgi:phosphoketolase
VVRADPISQIIERVEHRSRRSPAEGIVCTIARDAICRARVTDVIDRVPSLGPSAADVRHDMGDTPNHARRHTREHGIDAPEVTAWIWRP